MIVFELSFQYGGEIIMIFYTEVITAWLSILTTLITLYVCNWVL
jgi:hypothetical protein